MNKNLLGLAKDYNNYSTSRQQPLCLWEIIFLAEIRSDRTCIYGRGSFGLVSHTTRMADLLGVRQHQNSQNYNWGRVANGSGVRLDQGNHADTTHCSEFSYL